VKKPTEQPRATTKLKFVEMNFGTFEARPCIFTDREAWVWDGTASWRPSFAKQRYSFAKLLRDAKLLPFAEFAQRFPQLLLPEDFAQRGLVRLGGAAHPPTLEAEIQERLAELQRACQKSRGTDRDYHLLGGLVLCGSLRPLPQWLYAALSKLLKELLSKQQFDKHWVRHLLVQEGHFIKGLSWPKSYEYARDELKALPDDHPDKRAAGSKWTMEASYKRIQRANRGKNNKRKLPRKP
jgi:hypothetical protein